MNDFVGGLTALMGNVTQHCVEGTDEPAEVEQNKMIKERADLDLQILLLPPFAPQLFLHSFVP